MLRVHPVRGTQSAVDYYTGLAQEQRQPEVKQPEPSRHESSGDYYLQPEDEGGTWYGKGTKALGLEGVGTREQLLALFGGKHPLTGEQLGQAPREDSIRAYDLTFSAPKSVSVLATLIGGEVERQLVAAHDNAVKAVIDAIEERTTTRAGKNGVSRLDTRGLSALLVRHRTSRLLDPQLHTHALLISRVQGTDGRWRALDATHIFREQVSFGTIYQAALRAEVSRMYPKVRWGEVARGQAEIDGTAELNAIFSRRTEQMQERLQRLTREWKVKHPGRRITERERSQLERKAAKVSRPRKDRAREPQEIRAMARRSAAEHGFDDLGRLEREFVYPARTPELRSPSEPEIARAAILALVGERSVWSFERLERQIAERIGQTTRRSASAQRCAIEVLARKAAQSFCVDLAARDDDPDAARRLDREPALERYTTQPLIEVEQEVVRWLHEAAAKEGHEATAARMRHARKALDREADREGREAPELDPEQHAAASLVAGTHEVSVAVGPAGAGKTTMLRLATIALEQDGRSAIALSPQSVSAAEAGEATRLAFGTVREYLVDREREASERRFALSRGDTIILDEAGTMNTQDYHRLLSVCRSEGYRLALVGDPLQLSAVGRGGMMNHACEIVPAVELEKVHRFREAWEGEASLALRKARREVLSVYEGHGRIHSGDEEDVHERMLADWWAAHRSGATYAFSAPTRKQAHHLAGLAQQQRIEAGELDTSRHFSTKLGQSIYVGDTVQTRRNERRRSLVQGGRVRNREVWTVTAIARDGSVTLRRSASGRTRRVHPAYARERIELAYFSTVHAVQGRTVQRGGTLIDELAGFRSFYVGMTRARVENRAYVVADDEHLAREVCGRAMLRDRADLGVLAQQRAIEELDRTRRSRPERERKLNVIEQARERERERGGLDIEL